MRLTHNFSYLETTTVPKIERNLEFVFNYLINRLLCPKLLRRCRLLKNTFHIRLSMFFMYNFYNAIIRFFTGHSFIFIIVIPIINLVFEVSIRINKLMFLEKYRVAQLLSFVRS